MSQLGSIPVRFDGFQGGLIDCYRRCHADRLRGRDRVDSANSVTSTPPRDSPRPVSTYSDPTPLGMSSSTPTPTLRFVLPGDAAATAVNSQEGRSQTGAWGGTRITQDGFGGVMGAERAGNQHRRHLRAGCCCPWLRRARRNDVGSLSVDGVGMVDSRMKALRHLPWPPGVSAVCCPAPGCVTWET